MTSPSSWAVAWSRRSPNRAWSGLPSFSAASGFKSLKIDPRISLAFSICVSRRWAVSLPGVPPGALRARSNPNEVPITPPTSASSTRLAASTGPRFRRTNLPSRYRADGGQASTGSSFK